MWKYYLQRVFEDKLLYSQELDVFDHIKEKLPKEIGCARQIKRYIESTIDKTISEEEVLYLALHISRVVA